MFKAPANEVVRGALGVESQLRARGGSSSSQTTRICGRLRSIDPGVPARPMAARHVARPDREGSLLCQLRQNDDDAGRHDSRMADVRDWHHRRATRRIRDLPHCSAHRRNGGLGAATGRNDPLRKFHFRLEIEDLTPAGFSEAAIGDTTIEAVDSREGADRPCVRKRPGLATYANITLKRRVTAGPDLLRWFPSGPGRLAESPRRH